MKHWICDCPEGFFIPKSYSECTLCEAEQRYGNKKLVFPCSYKPFTPQHENLRYSSQDLQFCDICECIHRPDQEPPWKVKKAKRVRDSGSKNKHI